MCIAPKDDLDSEALWALLSEKERAEFSAALEDPSNAKVQEILEEHDIQSASFSPWWMTPSDDASTSPAGETIIPIPTLPSGPGSVDASKYLFNLTAIWRVFFLSLFDHGAKMCMV